MQIRVPIGDFSRATHLSVKTLRYYHRIGLLEPAEIDPDSGYRYYSDDQLRAAQIIRRLRSLQMPVSEVKSVLGTSDAETRNRVIVAHLDRLESELAVTRAAVTELRDLLDRPQSAMGISRRSLPATAAIAITEVVDHRTILPWWQGALAELQAVAGSEGLTLTGPPGGLFAGEIFQHGSGEATVFIPITGARTIVGRATLVILPASDLAVLTHRGSLTTLDVTYSRLAAYTNRHEISVDGPVREHYVTGYLDDRDPGTWETEVGWPIFRVDD
ncbi:MAG TPA: MerR family transcriptional regulator [Solirubrobacteraceae bacterium]|jgi:DNA-binding transcriptional MerR regulator|nr:MerR family transcriptional regulator [Solirubrobacteraceae bacterium]